MIVKKINKYYPYAFWFLLILSMIWIYRTSFSNYFFGDDFINFNLARVNSWRDVISFFNPIVAPKNFPFYRPLTTQFYYWLLRLTVGPNPLVFHLINFAFFLISLFLVYILVRLLVRERIMAYLTVFFYAFSSSHFYRLYYLSQFQELGLVVYYLSSLIFYFLYIKKRKTGYILLTWFMFILTFLAKETAITLPLAYILVDLFFIRKQGFIKWLKSRLKTWAPFILFTTVYMGIRFFIFGYSHGQEYQFVFNLKSTVNNLLWYGLWSLGLPELFVNVKLIASKYIINPELFIAFGHYGLLTMTFFLLFIANLLITLFLCVTKVKKPIKTKLLRVVIFSVFWFGLTLFLVAFFPFHKFSYSLTLPMFAIAFSLGYLFSIFSRFSPIALFISLMLYLIANHFSLRLAYSTHWSVKRPLLVKAVFDYFDQHYIGLVNGSTFYIRSYSEPVCKPIVYSLGRELDYALGGDKGIKLRYGEDKQVFYDYNIPVYRLMGGRQLHEVDAREIMPLYYQYEQKAQ
jgi:hypothetical protein